MVIIVPLSCSLTAWMQPVMPLAAEHFCLEKKIQALCQYRMDAEPSLEVLNMLSKELDMAIRMCGLLKKDFRSELAFSAGEQTGSVSLKTIWMDACAEIARAYDTSADYISDMLLGIFGEPAPEDAASLVCDFLFREDQISAPMIVRLFDAMSEQDSYDDMVHRLQRVAA